MGLEEMETKRVQEEKKETDETGANRLKDVKDRSRVLLCHGVQRQHLDSRYWSINTHGKHLYIPTKCC